MKTIRRVVYLTRTQVNLLFSECDIVLYTRQDTLELAFALRLRRIDGVRWRSEGEGTSRSLSHSY